MAGMVADTLALAKKDGQRKLKIVLVDDESWLREWLGSLIQAWFPEVRLSSFDEGYDAWNELSREAPDILITDMNRPGLNGWKMLPMIAERKPNYHVLVHSGGANESAVLKCAGPNLKVTFLSKPWQAEEFCRTLSILLGREPDSGSLVTLVQTKVQTQKNSTLPVYNAAELESWCQKGENYHEGKGVPKDDSEAAKWFSKAAEQGHARAQCWLGVVYECGVGVPQNLIEAKGWYRKSAEQGNVQAQMAYADYLGKSAEAVKWYRKAAEQTHVGAQYVLGDCYYKGEGVAKDYAEAVKWYRKAAERDHVPAQHNLGVCYANGEGVSQDYNEAVNWYRKAAKQNYTLAQNNLGACYAAGQGVGPDHAEALKWYLKAAEQGDAKAQFNAGVIYANSQDLPRDYAESVKWYRKAAEQSHTSAQESLGALYANGRAAIDTGDAVDAYQYVKLAEEKGYEGAAKTIAVIKILLSPEKFQEAERRYQRLRSSKSLDASHKFD